MREQPAARRRPSWGCALDRQASIEQSPYYGGTAHGRVDAVQSLGGAENYYGRIRRDVLHPAALGAEVPWVAFHTFRHTCASLLFAAGNNVKQVQVWLGHADPGFTVRT